MMLESLPYIEKTYSLKMLNNNLNDSTNLMSMNVGQQIKNSYSKPGGFKSGHFKRILTREYNKKIKMYSSFEIWP